MTVWALALIAAASLSGCGPSAAPRNATPTSTSKERALKAQVSELKRQLDGFDSIFSTAWVRVEPEPRGDVPVTSSGMFMGRVEEVSTGTPRPTIVVDLITDTDVLETNVDTRSGWLQVYGQNRSVHTQRFRIGRYCRLMARDDEGELRVVTPDEFAARWKAGLVPKEEDDAGSKKVAYFIDVGLDGVIDRMWPIPFF